MGILILSAMSVLSVLFGLLLWYGLVRYNARYNEPARYAALQIARAEKFRRRYDAHAVARRAAFWRVVKGVFIIVACVTAGVVVVTLLDAWHARWIVLILFVCLVGAGGWALEEERWSLLIGIGLALVLLFGRHTDTRYVIEYSASYDNVSQDPRPVDCDFLGSPIGDKDCHYERVVTADVLSPVHTVTVSWNRVDGNK